MEKNLAKTYDPKDFECEDNATFKAALPTVVKLMKKGFNDGLGAEVAYGDPINKLLPTKGTDVPLVLTMADVAIYQAPEDADEADKKNNGKPFLFTDAIYGEKKKKKVKGFRTVEEFEAALKRIRGD